MKLISILKVFFNFHTQNCLLANTVIILFFIFVERERFELNLKCEEFILFEIITSYQSDKDFTTKFLLK